MGARLTLIRRERGLTKAAVAQLAALSPSAYAKIENGGQSGVDTIERIAKS
ncbi:MAG: helix-turn-helix transcriptional regulator, partial [Myxococcales bacterium]|nr:helix-turn-helix transcriptional regulator [Myxococcales bacterium]